MVVVVILKTLSLLSARVLCNDHTAIYNPCENRDLYDDRETRRILQGFLNYQRYFDAFGAAFLDFVIVVFVLRIQIRVDFMW